MSLCFIDFGLGFSDGTAEAKGVDLYVLERALIRFGSQNLSVSNVFVVELIR